MLRNWPESSEELSPIRLLSDCSSEGLPSPEALKKILFSEKDCPQITSPIRNTTQIPEVIVLDDTPPSIKASTKASRKRLFDDIENRQYEPTLSDTVHAVITPHMNTAI